MIRLGALSAKLLIFLFYHHYLQNEQLLSISLSFGLSDMNQSTQIQTITIGSVFSIVQNNSRIFVFGFPLLNSFFQKKRKHNQSLVIHLR